MPAEEQGTIKHIDMVVAASAGFASGEFIAPIAVNLAPSFNYGYLVLVGFIFDICIPN